MWKPAGFYDVMDLGNNYFLFKFDLDLNLERVLNDGPWMIFDRYLIVKKWTPEFMASENKHI